MVTINCAAVQETLMETELFGHVRGAFTGAHRDKAGLFEVAADGTAFLDEVGDLPPNLQARLLRFLQDRHIRRVGATSSKRVDVRVLAATHQDLSQMVKDKTFREDLFFRLNVIPIVVPPLRERRDDIPLLVQHFAKRISEENNLRPRRFDARAIEAFRRYRWRGNIRELRNTVERLMIMTSGETVRPEDLPHDIRGDASGQPAPVSVPPGTASTAGTAPASTAPATTLREFKDTAERAYLVQKLRESNWNISKTAEVIDTPRSNLYKKLEQYGIKQDADG